MNNSFTHYVRLLFASAFLMAAVHAQTTVHVSVDAGKVINPLTWQSIGAYPQMGDADMLTPATLPLLHSAGIVGMAYPSGYNAVSQAYHWSTNTVNAGVGNGSQGPYVAPGNDMGHLAQAISSGGVVPLIQVNYGVNTKGTGGAEPKEAAAWVAYANGSPGDLREIGVDSIGVDWKTVGFWASLRAAQPLAKDDGYNFLRIGHAASLGIQLWQIGEAVAENGYYGGDHKGTLDLHAPYPASAKDNESRRKNKQLSASFYGEQVNQFATAMKAVDEHIAIGATLTTPTVDTWASGWNEDVLKAACKSLDFVSFSWHPGATLPPDWHTLDDTSVVNAAENSLPGIISEALYEDHHNCPGGKVPRIVFSQIAPIDWAKSEHPVVNALFAADAYATLAESGIAAANWYQLREGGILSKEGKPMPAFFGLQMLHIVAFRPGDAFLATTGASLTLGVHATRRQDGPIGVLLLNKDSKQSVHIAIKVTGVSLGEKGMQFLYGPEQATHGEGPVRKELKNDTSEVTVDVPPYSIVDLLLPAKK